MSAKPFKAEIPLAFLDALREQPNMARACRMFNVAPSVVRKAREKDPELDAAIQDALDIGIGAAEEEVHRRAFLGVEKPVYQGGVQVGVVQEFSDSLAMFLLKAHRPDRYREQKDVNVKGAVAINVVTGVPIAVDDLL